MEFQWSYFKSWKMMLWKGCTQYASKIWQLSSGHRPGKGQFSFQSQRKAMPKNAQTTAQLHSFHTLVKWCLKFSKPGYSNMWTVNFQMFRLVLEKAEEPEIKLPTSTGSWKKQESSRKTSISALLTMPKPLTVWITHSLVCFKCYLCASIFSLAFILVPWESILNTVAWMILLKYVRLYHCFNQKSSLTSYVT